MMVIDMNDVQREVRIRSRIRGAAVLVSDVMDAVEYEARRAAGQRPAGGAGYSYTGRAIYRGPDGVWEWCGLDESPGEDDVWVLYL